MKKASVIEWIRNFLFLFILFAVSGWVYEVINHFIRNHGEIVNRGYLFGPWLPIYGFGGMLIYGLFYKFIHKKPKGAMIVAKPVLLFTYITLLATAVELAATYIVELFGIPYTTLWDYSARWMNFEGRICFDASAKFGILGLVVLYLVLPVYKGLLKVKNKKVLNIILWTIIAVFAIDWLLRIPLGNNYAQYR